MPALNKNLTATSLVGVIHLISVQVWSRADIYTESK